MPTFIIKIDDMYCEWSTVVDAPVSYLMPLNQFKKVYKIAHRGNAGDLNSRLARVEKQGSSAFFEQTAEDLYKFNRAGKNEECLTKEELIKEYTRGIT